MKAMIITQLFIFPIKSLAGIAVNSSEITSKGLKYDRRWLIVDDQGVHVTQRTHPEMVLFETAMLKDGIKVTYDQEDILVPFTSSTKKITVDVWGDRFECLEVEPAISKWFTDKLHKNVKLVYQSDDSFRQADQKYATSPKDDVSAADGFPMLMISEESLVDLNERLAEPVEMLRFRPNIVVSGLPAYGEDQLKLVSTNEISMLGVKNCGRCIMITNDINTGKLGKEPLNTLAGFRKNGNKVLFGQNFIPQKLGVIRVGDSLLRD